MDPPRRNRVDPWGDLQAVADRGLFTGNRGCLVDEDGRMVRHHAATAWITCVTGFGDRRQPLASPRRWTPLFFLDDAVALAAGHRPCATCRRADYRAYRDAVTVATGAGSPVPATEIDARLRAERLHPGRGLARAADRIVWSAPVAGLPDGTVVVADGRPCLVVGDHVREFSSGGWGGATARPAGGEVGVLTPPTSVAALTHGFTPTLHPSAGPQQ
jgi:hypothetical protein